MSSMKSKNGSGGGILKKKTTFRTEDLSNGQEKKPSDKLEEEFNESFKARQRRRSSGTILPIAAERVKLEASVKLNIPHKPRVRQLSSEYCEWFFSARFLCWIPWLDLLFAMQEAFDWPQLFAVLHSYFPFSRLLLSNEMLCISYVDLGAMWNDTNLPTRYCFINCT